VLEVNQEDLKKLSPDELIRIAESDTSTFRYDRYHLYQTAFDKYKASDQLSQMENMRRELCALQLSTNSKETRFCSLWKLQSEDGKEIGFPDLERDFPDDAIEYYKQRASDTQNPILKARYCDVIWEKKKDHIYGRNAVRSYLECWSLYFRNGWDHELVDSLTRALSIACMLNDQNLIDLSLQANLEAIDKLANERRWHRMADIIESIVSCSSKHVKTIDYSHLLEISELAIKDMAENEVESFHFQRALLEEMTKIYRIQKSDAKILEIKERFAETFIAEGDWKKTHYPSGNLVAVTFYTSALREYMNIGGFDDKIEELKLKIAETNKAAQSSDLKPISVEIDIPTKPIKKHIEFYQDKSEEDIYKMISLDRNLLPSYESSIKAVENLSKEFVLQQMMPLSIMKGNIQIKRISGGQEKLEYQVLQSFQLSYRTISNRLLEGIFTVFETKTPNYLDGLYQHLANSEIIGIERLKVIKCGLDAYGGGNYAAAFHILVFQIEGILRDFVGKLNLPTFTYRTNGMREIQLNDILDILSKVEGFDKDLGKFLEIFLCRIEGDNLRNDTAHGLLTINAFSKENCQFLLLCLIKLAPYSVVNRKNEPQT
jgi:hypothetical protein